MRGRTGYLDVWGCHNIAISGGGGGEFHTGWQFNLYGPQCAWGGGGGGGGGVTIDEGENWLSRFFLGVSQYNHFWGLWGKTKFTLAVYP